MNNIQNEDAIMQQYEPLVLSTLIKLKNHYNFDTRFDDDLLQEIRLTLLWLIRRYDSTSDMCFGSYLKVNIFRATNSKLSHYYKYKNRHNHMELEYCGQSLTDNFDSEYEDVIHDTIEKLTLSIKGKSILRYYYLQKLKQSEIANIVDCTAGYVSTVIKDYSPKIYTEMEIA